MHYLVKEPGKDGGTICQTPTEAVNTAIRWFDDTGIPCEIYAVEGEAQSLYLTASKTGEGVSLAKPSKRSE